MSETKQIVNELLVDLFHKILSLEEKSLKKSGMKLTLNDVHILETIQKETDKSMSNIARKLMITQGTLTTNVNKLIRNGFITRHKDSKDKRIYRLQLEEEAAQVLCIHEGFHQRMVDTALETLTKEQEDVLTEALTNVMTYFRSGYEE